MYVDHISYIKDVLHRYQSHSIIVKHSLQAGVPIGVILQPVNIKHMATQLKKFMNLHENS